MEHHGLKEESMCHYAESQHTLYHIFRYEKRHRLEDVAEKIGISVSTLNKYILGISACPTEVVKRIYIVTRHPMLKELLEPEGHELLPREKNKLTLLPTVDAHTVEAMTRLIELKTTFEKYFEDAEIDPKEFRELKILKGQAADAVNLLFSKIASMVKPEGGQRVRAVS